MLVLEFAASHALVRRALEARRAWIEAALEAAPPDLVLFKTDLPLAQAPVRRLLGRRLESGDSTRVVDLVVREAEAVETPACCPPMLEATA